LNGNAAAPGLENRYYGRGDPLRDTLYQLKLALSSSEGCGRSVGIVRLRTKATELVNRDVDYPCSFISEEIIIHHP
jgi:hypothetical protein